MDKKIFIFFIIILIFFICTKNRKLVEGHVAPPTTRQNCGFFIEWPYYESSCIQEIADSRPPHGKRNTRSGTHCALDEYTSSEDADNQFCWKYTNCDPSKNEIITRSGTVTSDRRCDCDYRTSYKTTPSGSYLTGDGHGGYCWGNKGDSNEGILINSNYRYQSEIGSSGPAESREDCRSRCFNHNHDSVYYKRDDQGNVMYEQQEEGSDEQPEPMTYDPELNTGRCRWWTYKTDGTCILYDGSGYIHDHHPVDGIDSSGSYTCEFMCEPLTECRENEYMVRDKTETSDRECVELTHSCEEGKYLSSDPHQRESRVCSDITTCEEGQYEILPPTNISDRRCGVIIQADEPSDPEIFTLRSNDFEVALMLREELANDAYYTHFIHPLTDSDLNEDYIRASKQSRLGSEMADELGLEERERIRYNFLLMYQNYNETFVDIAKNGGIRDIHGSTSLSYLNKLRANFGMGDPYIDEVSKENIYNFIRGKTSSEQKNGHLLQEQLDNIKETNYFAFFTGMTGLEERLSDDSDDSDDSLRNDINRCLADFLYAMILGERLEEDALFLQKYILEVKELQEGDEVSDEDEDDEDEDEYELIYSDFPFNFEEDPQNTEGSQIEQWENSVDNYVAELHSWKNEISEEFEKLQTISVIRDIIIKIINVADDTRLFIADVTFLMRSSLRHVFYKRYIVPYSDLYEGVKKMNDGVSRHQAYRMYERASKELIETMLDDHDGLNEADKKALLEEKQNAYNRSIQKLKSTNVKLTAMKDIEEFEKIRSIDAPSDWRDRLENNTFFDRYNRKINQMGQFFERISDENFNPNDLDAPKFIRKIMRFAQKVERNKIIKGLRWIGKHTIGKILAYLGGSFIEGILLGYEILDYSLGSLSPLQSFEIGRGHIHDSDIWRLQRCSADAVPDWVPDWLSPYPCPCIDCRSPQDEGCQQPVWERPGMDSDEIELSYMRQDWDNDTSVPNEHRVPEHSDYAAHYGELGRLNQDFSHEDTCDFFTVKSVLDRVASFKFLELAEHLIEEPWSGPGYSGLDRKTKKAITIYIMAQIYAGQQIVLGYRGSQCLNKITNEYVYPPSYEDERNASTREEKIEINRRLKVECLEMRATDNDRVGPSATDDNRRNASQQLMLNYIAFPTEEVNMVAFNLRELPHNIANRRTNILESGCKDTYAPINPLVDCCGDRLTSEIEGECDKDAEKEENEINKWVEPGGMASSVYEAAVMAINALNEAATCDDPGMNYLVTHCQSENCYQPGNPNAFPGDTSRLTIAANVCPMAQLKYKIESGHGRVNSEHWDIHGNTYYNGNDTSGQVGIQDEFKDKTQLEHDFTDPNGICNLKFSENFHGHKNKKERLINELLEETLVNQYPDSNEYDLECIPIKYFGSWEYQKDRFRTTTQEGDEIEDDSLSKCAEACELNDECHYFWLYDSYQDRSCCLKKNIPDNVINDPSNITSTSPGQGGKLYKFDRTKLVEDEDNINTELSFLHINTLLETSEKAKYCQIARNYIIGNNIDCERKCCGGDCNVFIDHHTGYDVNSLCYTEDDRTGGENNLPGTGTCVAFNNTYDSGRYGFNDPDHEWRRNNLKYCDNYVGWRNAGEHEGGCTHAAVSDWRSGVSDNIRR